MRAPEVFQTQNPNKLSSVLTKPWIRPHVGVGNIYASRKVHLQRHGIVQTGHLPLTFAQFRGAAEHHDGDELS